MITPDLHPIPIDNLEEKLVLFFDPKLKINSFVVPVKYLTDRPMGYWTYKDGKCLCDACNMPAPYDKYDIEEKGKHPGYYCRFCGARLKMPTENPWRGVDKR